MFSFLTLLSTFLSYLGISQIYKGKKEENNKKTMKGIIAVVVGVIGLAFFNPIFDGFILSLLADVIFILASLGLISYTFLNTHPESIIVKGEVLDKEDNTNNVPSIEENKDINITQSSLPISVKVPFADKLAIFRKK